MMGGGVGCVDEKHIKFDDRKKTHYILRWEVVVVVVRGDDELKL